ncbi:hypothetical protein ABS755_07150 [Castellaniella sp. FW104-16D08]|jgi:hypothetical protein|uniref:hypothetical protein n=1 Tax=unclassified Castellaniella TaxID=2617606 RepID=UPI0033151626
MNTEQGQSQLAEGLACDIREAIHKYDGAVLLATTIGVLEILKSELMAACRSVEADDDD